MDRWLPSVKLDLANECSTRNSTKKIKRTFSLARVLGQGERKCIYEIKLTELVLPDIFYFGCSGFRFQFCSSSFYCAAAPSPSGVLIPSALVRSSLGIVSHVSFKPSHH